MKSVMRTAAIATFAAITAGAGILAAPAVAEKAAPKREAATKGNWGGHVEVTANGSHRLGNPRAPVQVTEYVSYTCSHCAHFHKEADPVLRLTVVPKGQVAVTVTNLLRNPVDMTVAMLTACGDPKSFFARHNAFMNTQESWLSKAASMSEAQQQRWYTGDYPTRLRAVASDFGFYAKMEQFGMTRARVDQCLSDKTELDRLRAQMAEAQRLGIASTPSFTLNGKVLADVHSWGALSAAITAALTEHTAEHI